MNGAPGEQRHVFTFEFASEARSGFQLGYAIAATWEDAIELIHGPRSAVSREPGFVVRQLMVITEAGDVVLLQP